MTDISASFTGVLLKVALIAGLIIAFATGALPVIALSKIPTVVWIIIIVVIFFIIIRGKK